VQKQGVVVGRDLFFAVVGRCCCDAEGVVVLLINKILKRWGGGGVRCGCWEGFVFCCCLEMVCDVELCCLGGVKGGCLGGGEEGRNMRVGINIEERNKCGNKETNEMKEVNNMNVHTD
jgi:hypothetical protein